MKYRKKPVVIEAIQYLGSSFQAEELKGWMTGKPYTPSIHTPNDSTELIIPTLEGNMIARPGDWIIKGVNGEFYPCKDEIFRKTYEPATS